MSGSMEKLVRFLETLKLSHAVEDGTMVPRPDNGGERGIGQTVRLFPSSTEQFLEQTAAVASSLSLQGQTLLGGGVSLRREATTGKRERMAHCQTVADIVVAAAGGSSSSGGRSPEAARLLCVGVETLLLLSDDRAPDVRMTADEALNRIVRGVSSAQVAKVLVEQMKDKLNGTARVLRAALSRFAVLAKHIRVQKGRAYMQTLVPLLCRLAERPEESIHESVAAALACICPALGHFANDGELKLLLAAYQVNLGHESSAVRRAAAQAMLGFCKNARKPALFLGCLVALLVKALVPPTADLPRTQVLGYLVCLRYAAPELVTLCPPCADSRAGVNPHSGQPYSVTVDQLLQVYQLSMHYCNSPDHNTVTASLELLRSLLEHAPAALVTALVTPGGVTHCYIDDGLPSRTPSCGSISGLSTVEDLALELDTLPGGAMLLAGDSLEDDRGGGSPPGMTVLGATDSLDDIPSELAAQGTFGKNLLQCLDSAEQREMENTFLLAEAHDGEDIYSSIEIGKLSDEENEVMSPQSAVVPSITSVGEEMRPEMEGWESEEADYAVQMPDEPEDTACAAETLTTSKGNIGCGHGPEVSGRHAVRLMCSRFLLAGHSGSLLGERNVRVSNKVLALACLTKLLTWLPEMMEETLYLRVDGDQGEDELVQRVWDVSRYTGHSDPSVCAAAATLLGNYLRAASLNAATHDTAVTVEQHTPYADATHQPHGYSSGEEKFEGRGGAPGSNPLSVEALLDQLQEVLSSESAVAARGALTALRACLPTLLRCQHQPYVLQLLPRLLDATTHPYWLIRVEVCELLCQLPLAYINFLEQSESKYCRRDCVTPTRCQPGRSRVGGQFSQRVLQEALLPLLPDSDHRVRAAAVAAISRLVPQMALSGDLYSVCVSSLCQPGRLLPMIPTSVVSGSCGVSALPPLFPPFDALLDRLRNPHDGGLEQSPAAARPLGSSSCTVEATKLEYLEQRSLDDSLSRVVHLLFTTLFTMPERSMKAGCVQALCQLSQSFPPLLHIDSWGCTAVLAARCSPSPSGPSCLGTLQQVLSLTADPGLTSDLPTLAACTTLACNLLAGLGVANLQQQPPPPPRHQPSPFAALGSATARKTCLHALLHVSRVMLVYWHVLEEVPPSGCTPASHLQTPSLAGDALSPLKRKARGGEGERGRADAAQLISEGRPAEGDKEKNTAKAGFTYGSFSHLPQYLKLYEVIKSAHNNYKMSVCVLSEQRLSSVLCSALSGLSCLLEVLHTGDILAPLEQLLQCCTAATHLLPQQAVQAAQQLVKCLFGSNLAAQWHSIAPVPPRPTQVPKATVISSASASSPTHACAVQLPLLHLCREIEHVQRGLYQQIDGGLDSPDHSPRRPSPHRPSLAVRPALGSYIRLFEPLVIKALNLYTVSNSVWLQRAVLELLVCLVHIRVNYCLLDSNQIFLRYVIKQLEHIEEGHVRQADVLIPALFSFLVAVSYERQHSRSIITIPKILQLSDGLLASGQPPLSHCVLALGPLVQEVFGNSGDPLDSGASPPSRHTGLGPLDVAELATKKEVLACTLLRLAHYHQVVRLAGVMVQGARQQSHQRWLEVSTEVAEVLLPLLANQQMNFHSLEAVSAVLEVLCGLCPNVFTPADTVLRALLTSPVALESTHSVEVWVASVVVVLRVMVTSCSPVNLLTRLGELGLSMHYVTAEEMTSSFNPSSSPAPAPNTPTAFASFSNYSPVRRKLATELRSPVVTKKDSTGSLHSKDAVAPTDAISTLSNGAVSESSKRQDIIKTSSRTATPARIAVPTSVTPQPALTDPLNVTQGNIKPDTAIARFLLEVLRVCCSEVRSVWYLRCQAGESAIAAGPEDDSFTHQPHEQDERLLVLLAHQLMLQLLWMADHDEWSVVSEALRAVCVIDGDQGGAGVLAEVCECVASVRTAHPSLTLLCCQLHATLHLPGLQLWPLVLRSQRRKAATLGASSPSNFTNGSVSSVGPSGCLSLQYLRETALLLFVPYVTQHLCEEEWLAWVLVQHTSDVVALCDQPAMRHLLHAVHASAAASALLLHALSTRDGHHLHSAEHGAALVAVISNVHASQSGTLVIFLIQKMLMRSHFLHLTGTVCSVLRHRLQLLLAPSTEQELQQVKPQQLQLFTGTGRWAASLRSRYPELASELHRLLLRVSSCPGDQLQPIDEDGQDSYPVNSGSSDHAWFLRLVAKRCSSAECGSSEECCQLLLQLEHADLVSVMSAASFSLHLLQHTLQCGLHATLQAVSERSTSPVSNSPDSSPNSNRSNSSNTSSVSSGGSSSSSGSGSEHALYAVSRSLLLHHLQRLVAVLPKPHYDYRPEGGNKYSDGVNQLLKEGSVGDEHVQQLLQQLVPACARYLQSLGQLPWRAHLESGQATAILRFAMLAAECLQWHVQCGEGSVWRKTTCLKLLDSVLLCPTLCARLNLPEHSAAACTLVAGLHCALTNTIAPATLATLPESLLRCLATSSGGVGVAAGRLMQLVQWLERPDHTDLPPHIAALARSLVIGLGRWPCLNGVLRCPPALWTMGWEPALPSLAALPPLPPHLLHEPSILKQCIFRSQLLGWLNRQQFEETWMALLSVLNASTTDDNEPQEQPYRNQIVCLCARGLRALLSQTLLLPTPGNPHTARTTTPTKTCSNSASEGGLRRVLHELKVRQEVVQHLTAPAPFPETQSPPHRPLSVHLLATALLSPASPSSGGGPPSPSEAPEHTCQLAAMGIDVFSCTHFLLDLFAAWFAPGKSLCSSVVSEVAKCLCSLVPVLGLGEQQAWLVRTSVALHAAHPLDDHSTHLHLVLAASHALAICRAADVDVGSASSDGVLNMLQWGLSSANTGVRTATLQAALLLLQPPSLALPSSLSTPADTAPLLAPDTPKSKMDGGAMRLLQGSPLPRSALTVLSSHIKTAPDCTPPSASQDPFLVTLLQLAAPYVLKACDSRACDSEAHSLAAWEMCLQLVEQHGARVTDQLPATTALQLALTTAAAHGTTPLLRAKVLLSVHRILAVPLASLSGGSTNEVVLKLVLDLVQRGAPAVCLATLPLLLALLYNSLCSVTEEPEQLLQLMERLGAVLERIRSGLPHEAWLLTGLLGPCLLDLLPANQSLNKVIMEYISSQQPRPHLLAHTLFQVFEGCVREGGEALVQEWVLMSLGNFSRREPASLAVWCLTCFLVAASRCHSLRSAFPSVLCWPALLARRALYQPADLRPDQLELFCLAAHQFASALPSQHHKQKFRAVFTDVATPGSPFAVMLQFLDNQSDLQLE